MHRWSRWSCNRNKLYYVFFRSLAMGIIKLCGCYGHLAAAGMQEVQPWLLEGAWWMCTSTERAMLIKWFRGTRAVEEKVFKLAVSMWYEEMVRKTHCGCDVILQVLKRTNKYPNQTKDQNRKPKQTTKGKTKSKALNNEGNANSCLGTEHTVTKPGEETCQLNLAHIFRSLENQCMQNEFL